MKHTLETLKAWLENPDNVSMRAPATFPQRGFDERILRNPFVLERGLTVSIQQGATHYCSPDSVEMWNCPHHPMLEEYGSGEDPYGWVPLDVVVDYLNALEEGYPTAADRFREDLTHACDLVERLNASLWAVQLRNYPDSVRLTSREVLDLIYEDGGTVITSEFERWCETAKPLYREEDWRAARCERFQTLQFRHWYETAKAIAFASVQNIQGFFYKCGKKPDGTYRWIGYRYGVEDHEYMSGFEER